MATIARRLPRSDFGRQQALNTALNKNSITPGPLNATTVTRLTAMKGAYDTGIITHGNAKAAQGNGTPVKDAAIALLRMFISHFVQVFNLGVRRAKYPAADRSFYQINISSESVPNLDDEDDVLLWGSRLVTGDPLRVAAGGAAMENPDIAEVATAHTGATTAFNTYSTLAENLDTAEEALAALNPDADTLIKRIWDEVETFYGEEEPSSKRENARRWGVIYVSTTTATLTGLVKDGGVPRPDTEVTLDQTSATVLTNAEGRYTIVTNLIGDATLSVHGPAPDNPTGHQFVVIPEHHDDIVINVPDIIW